jgi:hypothetical protein
MKKFTVMILCVSTFFIGLGYLMENVGARFKSDERALEIVRQARQAIGGDAAINAVQSLTISGKATKNFEFDNTARTEKGDWELNLQMPNKISKMLKIGVENGGNGGEIIDKKFDVVIVKKAVGAENETDPANSSQKVTVIKKGDKTISSEEESGNRQIRRVVTEDISGNPENFHRNELFRTMLFLLLTTPQGSDANYVYAGEANIDGTNCEIVQVNSGGASVKLYLDKSSHLPVMASFTDAKPLVFRINPTETNTDENKNVRVVTHQRTEAQMGEFQIKFSDYRTAGGLQLPHKWTQTVDAKADETIEVSAYEINPANIAEKFNREPQKIMIRTAKP